MSKQTAVDWLFEQLPSHLRLSRNGFDMWNQAKELEKQQIKEAHISAHLNHIGKNDVPSKSVIIKAADQYYTDTYDQ